MADNAATGGDDDDRLEDREKYLRNCPEDSIDRFGITRRAGVLSRSPDGRVEWRDMASFRGKDMLRERGGR